MPFGTRFLLQAIAALALLAAGAAFAQDRSKPVTIIVQYPPDDFADNATRQIAPELGRALGQTIVVENWSGASGQIGINALVRALADGNTLAVVVPALLSVMPVFDPKYAEVADRLTPVMFAVRTRTGVAINPAMTPVRDFREFVEYARANPVKISYGSHGVGTLSHLWSEQII